MDGEINEVKKKMLREKEISNYHEWDTMCVIGYCWYCHQMFPKSMHSSDEKTTRESGRLVYRVWEREEEARVFYVTITE